MSKIAWLDYDGAAREKALQLLSAFQEKESVDELGLGTIRDALSDKMFPGTSTLMTRLRYMLFVPWIFKRLEDERVYTNSFLRRADDDERNLVRVLKAKYGLEGGVIGARSGEFVKRLPSDIYWAGLRVWGIRQKDISIDEYGNGISSWYAELNAFKRSRRRSMDQAEDLGSADAVEGMWCKTLPKMPNDFPRQASFDLTKIEALFLKEHILRNCQGSVLATLASGRYAVNVEFPWMLDLPEHRVVIHHAKMFALVMNGATILYNVLLSRHCNATIANDKSSEWVANHEAEWKEWLDTVSGLDVASWNLEGLFDMTPRVPRKTKEFVRYWVALIRNGPVRLLESNEVGKQIRYREEVLKGKERSRFINRKALEQWNANKTILPFNYRWHRVSRLVADLYAGLEAK